MSTKTKTVTETSTKTNKKADISKSVTKLSESTDNNNKVIIHNNKEYSKIEDLCCDLLSIVDHKNDHGHTIGLSYKEILKIVNKYYPSTTIDCLRWYRSKINCKYKQFANWSVPSKVGPANK